MLLLLWLFGAYATQQYLVGVMVAGLVPIAFLAVLVKWLREAVARDWDKQGLRFQLWRTWLWAYVMAFGLCVYLILMLGILLVHCLE